MNNMVSLKRGISLPVLIFYGLGIIVGAGIYALTGKVVGHAGMYAPFAFLVAALVALFTAFSFAELSSRFPKSAGEAIYVHEAFGNTFFTRLIGWLVALTGLITCATLSNAASGFITDLFPLPRYAVAVGLVLFLSMIAIWGITQSALAVSLITLIELGGLFYVIMTGGDKLAALPTRAHELLPPLSGDSALWGGIMNGAFLAFFAYIGFEDLVNISEETKDARRSMPLAILVCVSAAFLLYGVIALIAVLSVDRAVLAASQTPLAEILKANGQTLSPTIMGLISIAAAVNGFLVSIIMSTRVLYGMAREGQAPAWLGHVSGATQTPIKTTCAVTAFILLLVLFFEMEVLARMTSGIILFIFATVNAALLKLKWDKHASHKDAVFVCPAWVAMAGFLSCGLLLVLECIQKLF